MKVILYSTNCPKCIVLEKKLDSAGVEYEINNNVDDILKLGIPTVPILSVNDNLLTFNDAIKWVNDQ